MRWTTPAELLRLGLGRARRIPRRPGLSEAAACRQGKNLRVLGGAVLKLVAVLRYNPAFSRTLQR